MGEIIFTEAQYVADEGVNKHIKVVVDGKSFGVPLDSGNRHYAEIMRQVEAGTLTIADAETP